MIEDCREYFEAVIGALSGGNAAPIDKVRVKGRRARSNAEASVDRLGGEPGVAPETLHHLHAVMVSSHSFVHAVMTMESALYRTEPVPARPATLEFAARVDVTLAAAAMSLRLHQALP